MMSPIDLGKPASVRPSVNPHWAGRSGFWFWTGSHEEFAIARFYGLTEGILGRPVDLAPRHMPTVIACDAGDPQITIVAAIPRSVLKAVGAEHAKPFDSWRSLLESVRYSGSVRFHGPIPGEYVEYITHSYSPAAYAPGEALDKIWEAERRVRACCP